ncbi:MAG TPA: citrate/2-methylcitrate synthase [Thermoanaerobaculia bacterium]|nr:citrate/2-methylcitrate synthase [Thermoanaerobaculia bacterium]
MPPRLEQVVATTLGISESAVQDDLRYQSTAEWSSLRHAALMLALEQAYNTEITEELIPELTSIAAIREFILRLEATAGGPDSGANGEARVGGAPEPSAAETIHRGLEGVYFDRTRTTSIDGRAGMLHHRGYSIGDLAEHASYEEMVHLLVYGELPRPAQLAALDAELKAARTLPAPAHELIRLVRDASPLEALRTTVSALPAFEPAAPGTPDTDEVRRQGLRLIARIPIILAAHHAAGRGREPVAPNATLGHAANFLYLLRGEAPTELEARIFDQDLVLHADHGSNASAFAARVATSTQADLSAAATAAMATFSGPLHGGALAEIVTMLETIVRTGDAAGYVEQRHRERQPVFGFGHRVYRTEDARARYLRAAAAELARQQGRDPGWLDAVEALRREMDAYSRHGVDVNVDLYTAVVYLLLGIPRDLFVAVFAASRMAGWLAQILEQRQDNTLIRPRLRYVGPPARPYVPLAER